MTTNEQFKEERDKIVKGLEECYKKLIEFKKLKNSPLVVMRNGKIVELNPNDVLPTTMYSRNGD
ncbi:MAG: hypothetical protein IPM92_14485 [Saprospiraceae bacterium]|nr:hypothetical protein [Saprospiraceae bacterium]